MGRGNPRCGSDEGKESESGYALETDDWQAMMYVYPDVEALSH